GHSRSQRHVKWKVASSHTFDGEKTTGGNDPTTDRDRKLKHELAAGKRRTGVHGHPSRARGHRERLPTNRPALHDPSTRRLNLRSKRRDRLIGRERDTKIGGDKEISMIIEIEPRVHSADDCSKRISE